MITHLRGRLTGKKIGQAAVEAVVEAGGLGYELALPLSAYPALPEPPAEVFLFTRLFIREEAWDLYGFLNREEREAFTALTSVSRVGPKLALTILSYLTPEELVRALMGRDLARLSAVKRVGTKTAERLLVELKDRAPKLAALCGLSGAAPAEDEVVSGLMNLGCSEAEAKQAARAARKEAESDDLAVILKLALNHLKKV
ncbi:MAG: Holliday junction branch migration protein RuvA [Deltaproteobacteria bacterium]|nr:Holliday junction branch migration protein RuvA [Deltaproteobacteria bacterium]